MADDKKPNTPDEKSSDESTAKPKAKTTKAEPVKKTSDDSTEKPKATAKTEPVKKTAASKKPAAAKPEALSDHEKAAASSIFKKNMSVEEEKRALDEVITGATTAEDKKKAIDEFRKLHYAEDIIKKKTAETPEGVKEVKHKASAAKVAASEKILSQSYVSDPDAALSRLADTFDKSARRWEMVVYPTMFAFILLAGYGFYLIYHLTHDIAVLSHSVTRMATIVSDATPKVTMDMRNMSTDMRDMSGELNIMSNQMETLKPMSNNIAQMTYTMNNMNRSVYGMQRDMSGMNRTISGGPFGFMKDVMPFESDSYTSPLPPLPMGAGQPIYVRPMPSPPLPVRTNPKPAGD